MKSPAKALPAKPLPISVDEAARKFEVPRRAIEIAQKTGELPRALTLTPCSSGRSAGLFDSTRRSY